METVCALGMGLTVSMEGIRNRQHPREQEHKNMSRNISGHSGEITMRDLEITGRWVEGVLRVRWGQRGSVDWIVMP